MEEPQPAPDEIALPDGGIAPAPASVVPAEREPFWGYSDVVVFAGISLPCLLAGFFLVRTALRVLHLQAPTRAAELVPAQFLGYALLFGCLALLFRVQYNKPFWQSLGWKPLRMPAGRIVLMGVGAAFSAAVLGTLLRLPTTPNQMTELVREPSALILVGVFGTTLGPLCEELIFRGFLQPLLVRTFGAAAGILLAAAPFGLLHFAEYGYSWRHAVLIALAGAAFGWMRHSTGSTRAATLMHASYNALIFAATIGGTVSPK